MGGARRATNDSVPVPTYCGVRLEHRQKQALLVPPSSYVPPYPTGQRRATYAEAASRYVPASPRFGKPTPQDELASLQPVHHLKIRENQQPFARKSDIYGTHRTHDHCVNTVVKRDMYTGNVPITTFACRVSPSTHHGRDLVKDRELSKITSHSSACHGGGNRGPLPQDNLLQIFGHPLREN